MSDERITGDKSPIVALILNLCLGWLGIGYFYIGQWKKGIIAILAIWILSWIGIGFIAWIAFAVDAYMQAKILSEGGAIGHMTWFSGTA